MKVSGVNYEVNWKAFKRGTSMFFPCLDLRAARLEIRTVTDRLRIEVLLKYSVEDGIRGLRVWRL